ncbi:hypothetical protein ABT354_02390 [Streptomyces sp. NPDC000594]|uniref:hypothetical protein n=1 Tax=Streptomyces sp. NPDC000594 TaxID=3154261 RepID=UPI003327006F
MKRSSTGTADQLIRVDRRYNGPPDSANGGYACGLIAARASRMLGADGTPVVHLHAPPPLDTGLRAVRAGRRVHVRHGERLIATVSHQVSVMEPVEFVPPALAERAMLRYTGHRSHPFPTCFVCGPGHRDGWRLAPGPVPGSEDRVACLWTPGPHAGTATGSGSETGSVAEEWVWAALDCPGGWALGPSAPDPRNGPPTPDPLSGPLSGPLVLGRMSARISALPRVGETLVLVGRGTPGAGRVHTCTTALFRRDGTELGRAAATWVRTAPPASLQDRNAGNS